jgi:hypothetical protein
MSAPKCNSNVNGQWYYSDMGGVIGNTLGAGAQLVMAASSSCMCLIFLVLSLSLSQGEPNTGVYLVYACTVSWLLSVVGSLIKFQMSKAEAKADAKKPRRPCVDPTGAVLPVEDRKAVKI